MSFKNTLKGIYLGENEERGNKMCLCLKSTLMLSPRTKQSKNLLVLTYKQIA